MKHAILLLILAMGLSGCIGIGGKTSPSNQYADGSAGVADVNEPRGFMKWILPDSGDKQAVEPGFRRLSIACFAGAIGLLIFRFRKEALILVIAAVAAPAVGRMADMIAGLIIYFLALGLVVGMVAAWYFVSSKFHLPDDGNIFTSLWAKLTRKKEPPYHVG
jgi:hypothetical protein